MAVPDDATSGKIKVVTPGGSDESVTTFSVRGPEPTITSFTPASGGPGTQVILTGANFQTTTNVTFNGVRAIFTLVQLTNLQATVPANATTGPIRVSNPDGSAQTTTDFVVGTSADVRVTITGSPNPAVAFGPLVYNIQAFNNGPLP
ncbi:MAG TPA: hypothetical protein DCE44_01920, partial [Verrucomicrobiales bacterium]|nr:hypothetical protein [Verrucomicrobiales bacterium]